MPEGEMLLEHPSRMGASPIQAAMPRNGSDREENRELANESGESSSSADGLPNLTGRRGVLPGIRLVAEDVFL